MIFLLTVLQFSVPIVLIALCIKIFKDKNILKNAYIKIALATLVPYIIFALINIPYFGQEWGDGYYAGVRTLILSIHYWITIFYFSIYIYFWKKKKILLKLLIIPIFLMQIFLFIKLYPMCYLFWTAI